MWKFLIFASVLIWSEFAAADEYVVPEARVEALEPKGFRVCIPDEDGIELFAFHGYINKDLPDLAAGDYSKDILRRSNGAWCFVDSDKRLKKGDFISYWTYVQVNRRGYRRDRQKFVVKTLVDANTPIGSFLANTPEINIDSYKEDDCGDQINDLSNTVNQLKVQVEGLIQANSRVEEELQILEMKNSRKALVLSGMQSNNLDPIAVALDFVSHKLGIPSAECSVVKAYRLLDGRIIFELKTASEKNQVLFKWRTKEKNLHNIRLNDIQTVNSISASKKSDNESDSEENALPSLDVRNGGNSDEEQKNTFKT